MQSRLCQSLCIKPYSALLESACLLMVMASSSKPQLIRLLALLLVFLHLSLVSIVHADPHGMSLASLLSISSYSSIITFLPLYFIYPENLNTACFIFLLILQKVSFVITTTIPIWMMLPKQVQARRMGILNPNAIKCVPNQSWWNWKTLLSSSY